jgi:hypothetical protein
MRALLATVCAWALAFLSCSARAELWGYVDGAGVAHFASQPLDSRYAPVLRQGQHDVGRVPGKTMPRSSLLTWLEIAPEVKALQPVLRDAARETGVDAELLKAIIAVESGYRTDLVSPRGAVGLMQITPVTGDRYASKEERTARPAHQRLLDPGHNVRVGARMLADLNQRYGGIDVALAAWNAGEANVRRSGGKMPPFDETRAHVQLVLELYWALLQQSQQTRARGDLAITPAQPVAP